MSEDSPKTVVTAVAADLLVAVAKSVVAVAGGSAAMAAEAVHSFVDAANQALLLVGNHRARREPDGSHPFGHGAEVYFWAIVVAGVIFAAGGVVTIVEGGYRFLHPEPPTHVLWSYVVLGIAFVADGYSLVVALRTLRGIYPGRAIKDAVRASKDPNVFVVVLEDTAALVGIAIAFAGTIASQLGRDGRPDAIASIAIGVVLCWVAYAMMREIGSLLIGESIDPEVVSDIDRVTREQPEIVDIRRVLTMTLGPHHVIVGLDVKFRDGLSFDDAAAAIGRIRGILRERQPLVKEIFVQSAS